MKFRILIILFLLFSFQLNANDFEIKVSAYSRVIPKGAPCYVEAVVKNISGKEISIAKHANKCFRGEFIVERVDGNPRKRRIPEDDIKIKGEPILNVLPIDWVKLDSKDIFAYYDDYPGEFRVWYEIVSYCDFAKNNEKEGVVKAWTGKVKSDVIVVNLVMPEGIDKQAYDYFGGYPLAKPDELLQKYPTSTYAGWALENYLPSLSSSINPELLLEEAMDIKPNRILNHCSTHATYDEKGNAKIMYADEIAREYAEKAKIFLEAHPDFYYAGPIYARLGTSLVILNRWQDAKIAYENALKSSWGNTVEIEKRKMQIKKMIELLLDKKLAKK